MSDTHIFLKLPGLSGEASAASHREEIELESISWGLRSKSKGGKSEASGGRPQMQLGEVSISKHFDLSSPGIMKQPVLGAVWSIIALGGSALALWLGIGVFGMDPMAFLTGVTAPFIFGSIIVLNMLQNSLFAAMSQPAKGLVNAIAAAAIGVVLGHLYVALAPMVTGTLASGPPGYDLEVWLANALLSVTFPFLIYHAVFFEYWPLQKRATAAMSAAGVKSA